MSNKQITIDKALELLFEANAKGISNYKIAKDTEITEASIGNYINKNTRPNYTNAKILISYFTNRKQESELKPECNTEPKADTVIINREVLEVLKTQSETILSQQRTIEKLMKGKAER